jgi:DNA-3-methyladenine glycosylase I
MPKKRCQWAQKEVFHKYHDNEWGLPVHDDRLHFELLILEGAQAGLSWETILKKRENYRKQFADFDPVKVARFTDKKLEKILQDPGVVRNRLKIYGARKNAVAFLNIQKEFGSFDKYIWRFVGDKTIDNKIKKMSDMPAKTELSDEISKDLKKRGMTFVGSTIIYAYLQAAGLINDHEMSCFCRTGHKK